MSGRRWNTTNNNNNSNTNNTSPMSMLFGPAVKYKKAPQAPKRFKSSYMFFSTHKHKAIRAELSKNDATRKINTTEVAKMVSKAWKTLPDEERETWEEIARKDKARYEYEKSIYNGPWKVPILKKEKKRRSNKKNGGNVQHCNNETTPPVGEEEEPPRSPSPEKPLSAFLAFANTKRRELRNRHQNGGRHDSGEGGKDNADTDEISSTRLAELWKECDPIEKNRYVAQALVAKHQYATSRLEWQRETKHRMEAAAVVAVANRYQTKMAKDIFEDHVQAQPQHASWCPPASAAARASLPAPGLPEEYYTSTSAMVPAPYYYTEEASMYPPATLTVAALPVPSSSMVSFLPPSQNGSRPPTDEYYYPSPPSTTTITTPTHGYHDRSSSYRPTTYSVPDTGTANSRRGPRSGRDGAGETTVSTEQQQQQHPQYQQYPYPQQYQYYQYPYRYGYGYERTPVPPMSSSSSSVPVQSPPPASSPYQFHNSPDPTGVASYMDIAGNQETPQSYPSPGQQPQARPSNSHGDEGRRDVRAGRGVASSTSTNTMGTTNATNHQQQEQEQEM